MRAENLRLRFEECEHLSLQFEHFEVQHVYRKENTAADAMANKAITHSARNGNLLVVEDQQDNVCS